MREGAAARVILMVAVDGSRDWKVIQGALIRR